MTGTVKRGRFVGILAFSLVALAILAQGARATFPGDNGRLVFLRTDLTKQKGRSGVYTAGPAGRNLKQLTRSRFDYAPSFDPEATTIAFSHLQTGIEGADGNSPAPVFTIGVNGNELKKVTSYPSGPTFPGSPVYYPVVQTAAAGFSPDGQHILYQANRIFIGTEFVLVDRDGLNPEVIASWPDDEASGPVLSPRGNLVAFTRVAGPGLSRIVLMKSDGSGRRALTSGHLDTVSDFSANGRVVAFTRRIAASGESDVFVKHLGTGKVRRLTHFTRLKTRFGNGAFSAYGGVFSPDGRFIAFTGVRRGLPAIYVARRDGSRVRRITPQVMTATSPDWGQRPSSG